MSRFVVVELPTGYQDPDRYLVVDTQAKGAAWGRHVCEASTEAFAERIAAALEASPGDPPPPDPDAEPF